MKRLGLKISGAPLRTAALMFTDFAWSGIVLWASGAARSVAVCSAIAGMTVVINIFSRCYHGSIWSSGAALNRIEEVRSLFFAVLFAYLAAMCSGYFNVGTAEITVLSFFLTAAGFPAVRFITRLLLKKTHSGQCRILIAGAGSTGAMIGKELAHSCYYGYEVLGFLDDAPPPQVQERDGGKWLGKLCDAPQIAGKYGIDTIICCLPPEILERVLPEYIGFFKQVSVVPVNGTLPVMAMYPEQIGFYSSIEFQNRILFVLTRLLKSIVEILTSVLAVILLAPLFCVAALLVKLSSSGSVFYTAERLGKNGKKFRVLKFRSMYSGSDSQLETLLEENPALKAEWEDKFKLKHDPRVTRIGAFLRRTSLDELPQFLNVIRGDMALIGPRPIVPAEISYYGKSYEFFKQVKPGITGLWQVSGRSDRNYEERVAMDMFYVMNWSVWLDWFIFLKTFYVVLFCKGAH